jgi:hypothetical protein
MLVGDSASTCICSLAAPYSIFTHMNVHPNAENREDEQRRSGLHCRLAATFYNITARVYILRGHTCVAQSFWYNPSVFRL